MKFLIDIGVGKKIEDLLKKSFDVKSVRDIDCKMPDFEILQLAVSEKRVVLTMDKDFGELVFNSGLDHNGVLLLRLENSNGEEKMKVVQFILNNYSDQIERKFCVFSKGKFRIRQK